MMQGQENETGAAGCCPPARPRRPLPESLDARDAALATLAKALSHPVRVAILRRLRGTDACVNELVGGLPLAQSTVSQHLKVLKEAGLIRGEIEGPRVSYCLEPGALLFLSDLLQEL